MTRANKLTSAPLRLVAAASARCWRPPSSRHLVFALRHVEVAAAAPVPAEECFCAVHAVNRGLNVLFSGELRASLA